MTQITTLLSYQPASKRKTIILRILHLLFFIGVIFFATPLQAQKENYDTTQSSIDEEEYDEEDEDIIAPPTEFSDTENRSAIAPFSRAINKDTVDYIKRQQGFAYMTYLDSALRAVQAQKDKQPQEEKIQEEDTSVFDSGIIRFIFYAAAIALVGFVLYRLFIGQGVFTRNKKIEIPEVELEETPDETDLEKALDIATNKKDYRLATRYLFLITLARLGEKGVLQLASEKTNYQYLTELSAKKYANDFAKISLQYEYVWFGNFPLSQERFSSIQQQHQQFLKQV